MTTTANDCTRASDERVSHALDVFLRAVASLVDKHDQLSAGLQARGFSAFGPDLQEERGFGGPLWVARLELSKENLGRYSVRLLNETRNIGYISPILPELYKSVGISAEESQESGASTKLLASLRAQARERGSLKLTVDELIRIGKERAYREAQGALSTAGLADVLGSRRTKQFLKSRLGDRGYRVVNRRTMFSSQVMSRRLDPAAALEIVIPRPGPATDDYLPRRNPRKVRPQFEPGEAIPDELVVGLMNNDWVTAIDLASMVPGFLAYNLSISWDLYIRGLDAFCTLFDLVEDDLIAATAKASLILTGAEDK